MVTTTLIIAIACTTTLAAAGGAILIGLRIRQAWRQQMEELLAPWDLRWTMACGQRVAFGTIGGLFVSFRFGVLSDPVVPLPRSRALLLRLKIPGAALPGFHLVVIPETAKNSHEAFRTNLGWRKAEERCWLAPIRGEDPGSAAASFARLSPEVRTQLRAWAVRAPIVICRDWEEVCLGRDAALHLVDGDARALSWLELRTSIALDDARQRLPVIVDELAAIARKLSQELSDSFRYR